MFIWKTAANVKALIETMTREFKIELIEGASGKVQFEFGTRKLHIPKLDSFASQSILSAVELMSDIAVSRIAGKENDKIVKNAYNVDITEVLEMIRCCETLKDEYPGAYWNIRDSMGKHMNAIERTVVDKNEGTRTVKAHDEKDTSFAACIASLYSSDKMPENAIPEAANLATPGLLNEIQKLKNTAESAELAREIAMKLGLPKDNGKNPDGTPVSKETLSDAFGIAVEKSSVPQSSCDGGTFFTSTSESVIENKFNSDGTDPYYRSSHNYNSISEFIKPKCVHVIARAFASKKKGDVDANARRGAILSPSQAGFVSCGRRDVWYDKRPEIKGKTYVYVVMDGSSSMHRPQRKMQAEAATTIAAGCEASGHLCRITVFQIARSVDGGSFYSSEHTVIKDWHERVVGNPLLLAGLSWHVYSHGGGTPMMGNARHANDVLLSKENANRRILILLSDGDFHYTQFHLPQLCANNELITVGIGRGAFFDPKKDPYAKGLPITAMSTNGFGGDIANCLSAGLAQSLYGSDK